jgi:hypothetical protein
MPPRNSLHHRRCHDCHEKSTAGASNWGISVSIIMHDSLTCDGVSHADRQRRAGPGRRQEHEQERAHKLTLQKQTPDRHVLLSA